MESYIYTLLAIELVEGMQYLILVWICGQQEWKFEKKSSDRNDDESNSRGVGSASEVNVDEEAPLIFSSRISHTGLSQLSNRDV